MNPANESNEANEANEAKGLNESKGLNGDKKAEESNEEAKGETLSEAESMMKKEKEADAAEEEKAGNEEREKMVIEGSAEKSAEEGETARGSTSVFVITPEGAEISAGVTPEGNADMTDSLAPENPNSNTQSKDCCVILWSVFFNKQKIHFRLIRFHSKGNASKKDLLCALSCEFHLLKNCDCL